MGNVPPGGFPPGNWTTNGTVLTYVFNINIEKQPLQLDLDDHKNNQVVDENKKENIWGNCGSSYHVGNQRNYQHREVTKKRILDAYSH